jgi:hypothetical protein
MRNWFGNNSESEFKSNSSGLWRRVVLWEDKNVLEVHGASISTREMEAAWTFENSTTIIQGVTTQKNST